MCIQFIGYTEPFKALNQAIVELRLMDPLSEHLKIRDPIYLMWNEQHVFSPAKKSNNNNNRPVTCATKLFHTGTPALRARTCPGSNLAARRRTTALRSPRNSPLWALVARKVAAEQ